MTIGRLPASPLDDAEREVRTRRFFFSFDPKPGSRNELVRALVALGAALLAAARPVDGLAAVDEAAELCGREPVNFGRAEALEVRAHCLFTVGRRAEACVAADGAIAAYREQGGRADGLSRLGAWLTEIGEHERALAAAQHNAAGTDETDALSELAVRLVGAGQPEQARTVAVRAAAQARAAMIGGRRPFDLRVGDAAARALERCAVLFAAEPADFAAAVLAARQSEALTTWILARSDPMHQARSNAGDLARRRALLEQLRTGSVAPEHPAAPTDWESASGITVRLGLSGYLNGDYGAAERLAVALVESGLTDLVREVIGDPTDPAVLSVARDQASGQITVVRLPPEQAEPVVADLTGLRRTHGESVDFSWAESDYWTQLQTQLQVVTTDPNNSPRVEIPGPAAPILAGTLIQHFWDPFSPESEPADVDEDFGDDPRIDALAAHYAIAERHRLVLTVR
jgi:tetratricopeptide (TPR) repeat protein